MQGTLGAKHSGGVAGQEKTLGGFAGINQLVQAPEIFKFGAAHSSQDGKVEAIEPGPAGGNFVRINGKNHFVNQGFNVLVKPGDEIEAGDVISDGSPNPAIVVQHKGVGEGAKYWVGAYQDAMKRAGIKADRRNVELMARALINHVRLTEEQDEFVPDDVVHYSTLESRWQPREGFQSVRRDRAIGKYLERPYLHYSIGTKVRPSVLRDLKEFGVEEVDVHDKPPPFEPEMVRGMANLQHDPEWLPRLYGSGLKKSLLSGVHRNNVTDEKGTSFVPSLVRGVDFGRGNSLIRQPKPGLKLPTEGQPFPSLEKFSSDYGPSPNPVPKPSFSQTPKTVKPPTNQTTKNEVPMLNSNISATPGGGQASYDPRIQELDQRSMDRPQTPVNPDAAYHGGFTGTSTPTNYTPEQFAGVNSVIGLAGALNPEALAVLAGQQNYARQNYQRQQQQRQQQQQQQMMLGGFPGLQNANPSEWYGEEGFNFNDMMSNDQQGAETSQDFWRADNPLAWGAGLGGAYGAGRLAYGVGNRIAPSLVGNAANYGRIGRGLSGNAITRNVFMLGKPGVTPTPKVSTGGKILGSAGKALRGIVPGMALYDAGETLIPALQGDWNAVNQKSQNALQEMTKNPLLYGALNVINPVKNIQGITAGVGEIGSNLGQVGDLQIANREAQKRIGRMQEQADLRRQGRESKERVDAMTQDPQWQAARQQEAEKMMAGARWRAAKQMGQYTSGKWTDPETGKVYALPDEDFYQAQPNQPTIQLGSLKPPQSTTEETSTFGSPVTPNPYLESLMKQPIPRSSSTGFEN